ncbi:MAG: STAS domain-containing protein [Clostridia bacterium]|nr:STAS domain-containing protein [Clostridia bacterium]
MIINKTAAENGLTLSLEGRLDTNTAPELEKTLNGSLDGVNALTFDLSGLEYISSAGLRILLAAHKKMSGKGSMKIRGAQSAIKEIFDITGFSSILTIE